jgi:hypothetical protein
MRYIFTLLFCCFLISYLFAGGKSALSTADQFAKATHTFQGSSLPYRIYIPEGNDPNKKYPLVLTLHGMGERGNDNNWQLTANKMSTSWAEPGIQRKNPCFVIAPQCPVTSGWTDSPVYEVLINLVESTLTKYNIDEDRVYITGLSMGGYGTWNCISLRPDLFAAAVPIAGWGNTSKGPVLKNMPIWAFHGQADNTVSVDNSRFMVEAIVNQGIEAIYTNCYYVDTRAMPADKLNNNLMARSSLIYAELYGYSHNVWDYAYNSSTMFDWVFSKRKFLKNAVSLTSGVNDTTVNGLVPIRWNTSYASDSVEIWFKSERQEYWKLLGKDLAGKQEFNWDTDLENECIYGKIRICLVDSASRVYSQTESAYFTIDQAGNGLPYVKLKTPDFIKASNILSKRIDVNYIANDMESDSVWVKFEYSANGGKIYSTIDSVKVSADNDLKTKTILFSKLLKSSNAVLKLLVYDQSRSWSVDSTLAFSNQLGIEPVFTPLNRMNDGLTVSDPYPNPAKETATISLELPFACKMKVSVFNSIGQLVVQKAESQLNSGSMEIHINTARLPNGIYTTRLNFIQKDIGFNIQKSNKLIVQH